MPCTLFCGPFTRELAKLFITEWGISPEMLHNLGVSVGIAFDGESDSGVRVVYRVDVGDQRDVPAPSLHGDLTDAQLSRLVGS